MNRRRFILACSSATATATAGCAETPSGGTTPTGSSTGDPSDSPADTPTASPDPTPRVPELVDRSFEVTTVRCGSASGTHDVTTADDTVTVKGVIDGRNTCYTAELVRGEYDPDDDTLAVAVEARQDDNADACGQCIVEVHYVATFEFDHGTPGRIEVEQRGATSTSSTVEYAGERATAATDGPTATDTAEAEAT